MRNQSSNLPARLAAAATIALAGLLPACDGIEDGSDSLDTTTAELKTWQTHATGAVPDDPELIKSKMRFPANENLALQVALAALPSSVDYTSMLPSPGNQGSVGACIAWTIAYAIKTFHEVKEVGWSPNSYDHQFSPQWVYNLATEHSFSESALVVSSGADTLAYYPWGTRTEPTAESRARAARFKSSSWYTIPVDATSIKTVLANRNLVALAFQMRPDFNDLNSTTNTVFDTVSCGSNPSPCIGQWHMITIIGYNDATQRFKVMNSWGTAWGTGGYGYIPYSFIGTIGANTYVLDDAANVPGFPDSTISSMLASSVLW